MQNLNFVCLHFILYRKRNVDKSFVGRKIKSLRSEVITIIDIGMLPETIGTFKRRNEHSNAWRDTESNFIALVHEEGKVSFGIASPAGCRLGVVVATTEEQVIAAIENFKENRKKEM